MGFGMVPSLLGKACLGNVEEGLQNHSCILTGMSNALCSFWPGPHSRKCLMIVRFLHRQSSLPIQAAFHLFCKRPDSHFGVMDPIQGVWLQLSIPSVIHILNCYERGPSVCCQILQMEVVV